MIGHFILALYCNGAAPPTAMFGVPASKRALAGSVAVVPLDGLTHGHVIVPKKAGALVRYSELGSVKGGPVLVVPEPP